MGDEEYMRQALQEAETALKEGNWPIGCVIVLGDEIIARARNQVYSCQDKLAHAETLALRGCSRTLFTQPYQATLYTTYEPCPMCFGAAILTRVRRVVFGTNLDNSGAMYLSENLPELFRANKFRVEVTRGVLSKECEEVFMRSELAQELRRQGLLVNHHS